MYKSKLQELCQRRLWNLPEYQTSKEGPDHNPRYITSVTVNGIDFQTPSPCRTAKESQNNAAKLALDHFFRPRPPSLPNQPSSSSSSAPQTSNSPSLPQPSPQPSFTQPSFPQTSFSFPQPSAPISTGSSSPASGGIVIIGSSSSVTGVEDMIPAKSVLQPEIQDAQATQINRPIASVKDNMTAESEKNDPNMQRLYKNQLQNYAQKRNLTLPVYSSEREGPPHASRFKCKVTIDGQTYESPQFFPTLKDAEHAAAKVALTSLSLDVAQEDDIGLYKNLLQELVQKEGLRLPVYSTIRSGEAHVPIFVSNVEIEGEFFTGEEARTKKQAEMSAAKVAYMIFKERKGKSNQSSLSMLPAQPGPTPGMSSPGSQSNVPTDLQHHVKLKSSIGCSHESVVQNPSEKDKATDCAAEVRSHHTAIPSSEPITVAGGKDSFSSEITTGCVDTGSLLNVQSLHSLPISDKLVDSSGKPSPASTSTGRKVTVYSRQTNVEITQGGTLLPISDENWAAYSYRE